MVWGQALCRDPRSVPAGGALEIECARLLRAYGAKQAGLEQYAITQFANALEVVPRTIAENSGGSSGGPSLRLCPTRGLAPSVSPPFHTHSGTSPPVSCRCAVSCLPSDPSQLI